MYGGPLLQRIWEMDSLKFCPPLITIQKMKYGNFLQAQSFEQLKKVLATERPLLQLKPRIKIIKRQNSLN